MSKHTPGPWFSPMREFGTIYVEARIGGGMLQEVAACGPTETAGQQEANARLIAAAPELLAIVKGVLGMLQNCSVTSGVCCCGEEIDRHSRAMDCGHTPVDSGAYYAQSLFKDVTAAITKATGEL